MQNFKSSKAIAVVTTALMIASIFWLMNTTRVNGSLEEGLRKEKLNSESLLSEKLLLEKDLQKLKDRVIFLTSRESELNGVVQLTSQRLEQQESEYNRIKKENMSLAQLKKQRLELQGLRNQLENEVQTLQSSYAELEARNNQLNATVASLQERNQMLLNDLNRAVLASVDHSEIHAMKGKSERLTVRAKRVRKLAASFEVASNLKNLSFRIIDGSGKMLGNNEGTIAFTSTPTDESFVASSDPGAIASKLQKVQMQYLPKVKMKSGVYTVEILNENLYVASMKVKLK